MIKAFLRILREVLLFCKKTAQLGKPIHVTLLEFIYTVCRYVNSSIRRIA